MVDAGGWQLCDVARYRTEGHLAFPNKTFVGMSILFLRALWEGIWIGASAVAPTVHPLDSRGAWTLQLFHVLLTPLTLSSEDDPRR